MQCPTVSFHLPYVLQLCVCCNINYCGHHMVHFEVSTPYYTIHNESPVLRSPFYRYVRESRTAKVLCCVVYDPVLSSVQPLLSLPGCVLVCLLLFLFLSSKRPLRVALCHTHHHQKYITPLPLPLAHTRSAFITFATTANPCALRCS